MLTQANRRNSIRSRMAGDEEAMAVVAAGPSQTQATAPERAKIPQPSEVMRPSTLRVASIFAMLVVWWVMTFFFSASLVPRPLETLLEVGSIVTSGSFLSEMGATLRRVGVGFGIAMLISIPLGILMGTVKWLESFFEPPVILGLTMPGLVWAVMAIMFFGLNETSAYAAVAVTILPMLTISLWQGTKSIEKDLIDMSTVFHASAWSKVWRALALGEFTFYGQLCYSEAVSRSVRLFLLTRNAEPETRTSSARRHHVRQLKDSTAHCFQRFARVDGRGGKTRRVENRAWGLMAGGDRPGNRRRRAAR